MRSLVVSTIVYFAAAFFIKQRLEASGMPRGMTRSILVFALALVAAYAAAALMDKVLGPS